MFRDYRNCMFRSEWLNDAKFKSLVANDGTDWCLKVRKAKGRPKAKVHFLGSDSVTDRVNVTDSDSDSDTDSGSDNDSVRIAIYFCYIVTCDFFHDD